MKKKILAALIFLCFLLWQVSYMYFLVNENDTIQATTVINSFLVVCVGLAVSLLLFFYEDDEFDDDNPEEVFEDELFESLDLGSKEVLEKMKIVKNGVGAPKAA